jgi:trehalose 6-phosphate phosphatase
VSGGEAALLIAPFLEQPATSVVCCDFDGTLSPIVEDPASARPVEGSEAVLAAMVERFADVVVVSGRPVDFLAGWLPADVSLVGLYGLEGRRHGMRWEHPNIGAWREVIDDLAALASVGGPPGMRVEPKGLSVTLHYRGAPEIAREVEALGRLLADRGGLAVRPARMSVELHPPVAADKGTVIERFAATASAAMFVGDDLGDLPAFDALDRLAATGAHVARVAVRSDEAPPALVERADLVVDGPPAVLDLFRRLAA